MARLGMWGCRYTAADPGDHVDINFNALFSLDKRFSDGGCAGKGTLTSFPLWQTAGLGQDQQSTLQDLTAMPDSAVLVAAKKLLGMD
jgi:hypothetical protein